ncbi:acetyl-CoA carboxylase biotin carboxyl carrier protein [Celeribacter sp.]|uniref:acetyl-CoA carboxylase biotin carboxyl carrier protein n=1 Tax=Celeribacter sp. TaxID=1890673 RepID=UPI003A8F1307
MSITPETLIARMEWTASNGLSEFSWSQDGASVHIKRETVSESASQPALDAMPLVVAAPAAAAESAGKGIEAPLTGLVYLSQQPGTPPFVTVGDEVKAGQTVCLIEAMKVMTSVTAETDGVIDAICIEDGASIEAGTLLMKVRA